MWVFCFWEEVFGGGFHCLEMIVEMFAFWWFDGLIDLFYCRFTGNMVKARFPKGQEYGKL